VLNSKAIVYLRSRQNFILAQKGKLSKNKILAYCKSESNCIFTPHCS